ncbi:MAG: hypothetical protein ACLTBS_04895 [Eisenbergiella sp.]
MAVISELQLAALASIWAAYSGLGRSTFKGGYDAGSEKEVKVNITDSLKSDLSIYSRIRIKICPGTATGQGENALKKMRRSS